MHLDCTGQTMEHLHHHRTFWTTLIHITGACRRLCSISGISTFTTCSQNLSHYRWWIEWLIKPYFRNLLELPDTSSRMQADVNNCSATLRRWVGRVRSCHCQEGKSIVSCVVIMSGRDRSVYFFASLPLAKLLSWAFLDLGCIAGLIALPPL